MHNVIPMSIFQSTTDLPRKLELPRNSFPHWQPPMGNKIIQHLAIVDIIEYHVVMMLMRDDFAHTADVGMMEEHIESGFSKSADFFRAIYGFFRCCDSEPRIRWVPRC